MGKPSVNILAKSFFLALLELTIGFSMIGTVVGIAYCLMRYVIQPLFIFIVRLIAPGSPVDGEVLIAYVAAFGIVLFPLFVIGSFIKMFIDTWKEKYSEVRYDQNNEY